MKISRQSRIAARLVALLFLVVVASATAAQDATGRFEVYCDGFGFFLAKVDGAPAPGKLVLFLRTRFPGVPYVPKEEWRVVSVYRDGCAAGGNCELLTRGMIRLDTEMTRDSRRVSGEYDIDLGGQWVKGRFVARERKNRHPPRICM